MTALAVQLRSQRFGIRSNSFAFFVVLGVAVWLIASREPGLHRGLILLAGLTVLAWISAHDITSLRAPNVVVYPAIVAITAAAFTLGVADGSAALAGGIITFAILLVAVLAGRGAMGYGDTKVGFVCGALVGIGGVLPMLIVTFLLGALFAAPVLILRLRERKDAVAFTPFLTAGVLFVLVISGGYLLG